MGSCRLFSDISANDLRLILAIVNVVEGCNNSKWCALNTLIIRCWSRPSGNTDLSEFNSLSLSDSLTMLGEGDHLPPFGVLAGFGLLAFALVLIGVFVLPVSNSSVRTLVSFALLNPS